MMGEIIGGIIVLIFVVGVSGMLAGSDAAILIVGVVIVTLGDNIRGVTLLTVTVDGSLLVTTTGDSLVILLIGVEITVTDDSLLVTTVGISLIVSAELVTDVVDSRQLILASNAFLQSIIAP